MEDRGALEVAATSPDICRPAPPQLDNRHRERIGQDEFEITWVEIARRTWFEDLACGCCASRSFPVSNVGGGRFEYRMRTRLLSTVEHRTLPAREKIDAGLERTVTSRFAGGENARTVSRVKRLERRTNDGAFRRTTGSASRTLAVLAAACSLSMAMSCNCNRQITETDDPDILERREPHCRDLCEVQVSECGVGVNEVIDSIDTCVHECAILEGTLVGGWGYVVRSDTDECAQEWIAHKECVLALSCEDQQLYFLPTEVEPHPKQRPCFDEQRTMLLCSASHPCCEEQ